MNHTWFRSLGQAAPGAVPLLCFPYAGGSAGVYYGLAKMLEPEVQVVSLQYPGRQDRWREAVVQDLGELADRIVDQVRSVEDFASRPFAFFGHSMGAILAFEVARRLAVVPTSLIASGRNAPHLSGSAHTHLLDDAGLLAEVERLGSIDRRLLDRPEVMRLLMPVLRGDYHAIETYAYQPGPALQCPVTALAGSADPMTTIDKVRAWKTHTVGTFDPHVLPGGHFFLNPAVEQVAAIVRHVVLSNR